MDEARIAALIARYRPPRGWLPFLLLLGALAALAFSVLEVNWVANDAIVIPAFFLGFLLAAGLAFGTARPWLAAVILIATGLALGVLLAAEMTPPPRVVAEGLPALADFWRIRAALFVDRAAGTSLAGQAVNEALVIDFSRHLDAILAIDPAARTARVQPGVVLDDLDAALRPYGLQFGPDPASSNRSTIGGAVANNATGSHSLLYGMTADHVRGMRVVLSDGSPDLAQLLSLIHI